MLLSSIAKMYPLNASSSGSRPTGACCGDHRTSNKNHYSLGNKKTTHGTPPIGQVVPSIHPSIRVGLDVRIAGHLCEEECGVAFPVSRRPVPGSHPHLNRARHSAHARREPAPVQKLWQTVDAQRVRARWGQRRTGRQRGERNVKGRRRSTPLPTASQHGSGVAGSRGCLYYIVTSSLEHWIDKKFSYLATQKMVSLYNII